MDAEDDDIFDEITAIEESLDDHESKIAALEGMAAGAAPGSQRWAESLAYASEHRVQVGDFATAIAQFEAVAASGVVTDPSATVQLLIAHLAAGHQDEASAIDLELRLQSRNEHLGFAYAMIGEAYEEAGDLKQALRWFSLSNRDIEPDDWDSIDAIALWGRQRVRQVLELPEDAYDVSARELREYEIERLQS
jgi:tetratricopeptide (TPR) repeat protein